MSDTQTPHERRHEVIEWLLNGLRDRGFEADISAVKDVITINLNLPWPGTDAEAEQGASAEEHIEGWLRWFRGWTDSLPRVIMPPSGKMAVLTRNGPILIETADREPPTKDSERLSVQEYIDRWRAIWDETPDGPVSRGLPPFPPESASGAYQFLTGTFTGYLGDPEPPEVHEP